MHLSFADQNLWSFSFREKPRRVTYTDGNGFVDGHGFPVGNREYFGYYSLCPRRGAYKMYIFWFIKWRSSEVFRSQSYSRGEIFEAEYDEALSLDKGEKQGTTADPLLSPRYILAARVVTRS